MPWAAAGAIGGAIIGGMASSSAADTQAGAARNAAQLNWDMFQQQRGDTAPWREAGRNALGQIGNDTSFNTPFGASQFEQFKAPNYEFQLGQGMKALTNRQSAGGGRLSGNSLQAINDYAQNYASGAYQNAFSNYQTDTSNRFNRLATVAGYGAGANQINAQAGLGYGGNIGNAIIGAGNAQAAGQIGQANAWSGGMNTLGGLAAWYQRPNNDMQSSTGVPPGGF